MVKRSLTPDLGPCKRVGMAYNNIAYETFLKGMETILREEFKESAAVYIAQIPQAQAGIAIRLWYLGFEAVDPPFLAVAQEYSHSAEVIVSLPEGDEILETIDARLEFMSRALRILNDNKNYSPASVYKWHDGVGDEGEKQEAEIDAELRIKEQGWRFVYSATVTEPIA
ncbi:hypothetical protein LCGC14_3040560 [marine sediment metagenome]|uniref:Uncharacterized protein n=1 Tax=marine sediment metagenome TaxID=412755 RepID=A0A0F8WPI9_9ZZZZ